MRGFFVGLIVGIIATVGALHYFGHIDIPWLERIGIPKAGENSSTGDGTTGNNDPGKVKSPTPSSISQCTKSTIACMLEQNKARGFSGSARINSTSHLVVHDLKNGPASAAAAPRLGIVSIVPPGSFKYEGVDIHQDAWGGAGKVSNDLESACRLSHVGNQFLVAESGLQDERQLAGQIVRKPWLGRLFHITLYRTGAKPTAIVESTPKLRIPQPTTPYFPDPDPDVTDREFPHSPEDYEGLACVLLNGDAEEPPRYLVILGERGGTATSNETGTLYWGEYDMGKPPADREIVWQTAADAQGIVGEGNISGRSPAEWRDITGLHVDAQRRLFATAAYDTNSKNPPFESAYYQLGVVCIDASDAHGQSALCDYSKPPRPIVLTSKRLIGTSKYHKLETVAAPSGVQPLSNKLSVASEDEDAGGVWWPSATK